MTSDRDPSNDPNDGSGTTGRTGDEPNLDELADRVATLESTLRELRRESLRPPRGPFGLPRPPTPREFVEFTDRHAIPATIAFLEAHVRALQALRAALRLVRGADETRERTGDARARTAQVGRRALDALDAALDDFADALEEGRLPENAEARSVLVDAQRLTEELRDELEAAVSETGAGTPDSVSPGADHQERSRGAETGDPRVDPSEVETELDVLRDEFGADESNDRSDDENGGGSSDSDED